VPLIKVVTLADADVVRRAVALPADVTVLIDARDPDRRGGTGAVANWRLAAALARRRPVWLAGGLTPANVGRAIAEVRPFGIDVSSGVETAPGRKSTRRLAALIAAVTRADRKRHDR
jgi:phosphoribosylanthranilate isomerase